MFPFAYARRVISLYLKNIDVHKEGVRTSKDREHLHVLRTSSRRLRNALWVFRSIFSSTDLKKWKRSIRALARASNEARDIDIHLEFLQRFQEEIKSRSLPIKIGPLITEFQRRKQRAQRKVLSALKNIEEEKTFEEISRFLATHQYKIGTTSLLRKIARKKIQKRLATLLKFSAIVHQPNKVKELHQMRIASKKMRYTLEGFENFYGRKIKTFTDAALKVQQVLGELHDYDVWIAELSEYEKMKRFLKIADGIAFLKDECKKRRGKCYGEFVALWRSEQKNHVWDKLEKLIEL